MDRLRKINFTFLVTVVISNLLISNLLVYIDDKMLRIFLGQISLALPAAGYMIIYRQKLATTIRIRKIRPANVALIILLSILLSPVLTLINAVSMLFSVNTASADISFLVTDTSFILATLLIAFTPALLEEGVYRGLFYNEYSKVRKGSAIFLSAFLFGLMHGNLNQCTYAFVIGIMFCLLVEATDSIVSSMILHFCINFSSVVLVKLAPVLLNILENAYNAAISSGDNFSARYIVESLGTDSFNIEEILANQTASSLSVMSFGQVLSAYGMPALICGVLAFFVFRTIARNANRWDIVKQLFVKDNESNTGSNMSVGGDMSLITWPLIAAVGLLIAFIIVGELDVRGIISI